MAARRAFFEPGVAVLLAVGVFDRVTGVLARDVGVPCWRDVLPLGATRFDPAGELDRVEAGLAELEFEFNFLTEIGSREEDDACGDGDWSGCLRNCALVLIGGSLAPARSLCDLPCDFPGLSKSGRPFFWVEAAPRYQSVGDAGSATASD